MNGSKGKVSLAYFEEEFEQLRREIMPALLENTLRAIPDSDEVVGAKASAKRSDRVWGSRV